MIPKIIHYTWFSDDPYPDSIQRCINSWNQYLSDYKFVKWDSAKIADIDSIWLKECLAERKWAFAADYVRLYAVALYGGIYLDTDFEVFRSFDDVLLNNSVFIGRETSYHLVGRETCNYLTSHCFGAEKNNSFIHDCLHYYDGRHFITSSNLSLSNELRLDMTLLPYIQAQIARQYGYDWHSSNKGVQDLGNGFKVYEECVFDPPTYNTKAYGRHLAVGSWRDYRSEQETVSLGYKLRWRIIKYLDRILSVFGYTAIRMT